MILAMREGKKCENVREGEQERIDFPEVAKTYHWIGVLKTERMGGTDGEDWEEDGKTGRRERIAE